VEHEKALYEHYREEIEADLNLLAAMEELDRFYLFTKLELMSRLVHYQNIAQFFADDPDKRQRLLSNRDITLQMVALMRQHQYWQDSPGIALYTTLLEFLPENNAAGDAASDRFADMLARHIDALPKARLDDFNVLLRSYWNRRYRHTKDPIFIGRLHGMHREQLQRLPPNKNLPMMHVTNMLNTALKLDKIAWAMQFLREYAGVLNEEPGSKPARGRPHPRYAVRIWWAMLFFAEQEFEKAADMMLDYSKYGMIDDIYFFSVAAATDVKIHYERGTLDDNLIRNILARLERNKDLPKDRRDERLQFFRAARRLFHLKTKKEIRRNADISKEIKELQENLDKNPTVDWEWLEEKIGKLKN
jgi:RNase H-fold protein (predicted Holliday junction resolvase)